MIVKFQHSATCAACATPDARCIEVAHRGRYSNGHRATTAHDPICERCTARLTQDYRLATEAELYGASYFVEGWSAVGLLAALDTFGGHE